MNARLAAPSNDQQGWNAKREIERSKRVDRITQPRVPAHHDGVAPSKPGAGCDRNGLALAGRSHIVEARLADRPIDQRRQKAAWYAGVEVDLARAASDKEIVGGDH